MVFNAAVAALAAVAFAFALEVVREAAGTDLG